MQLNHIIEHVGVKNEIYFPLNGEPLPWLERALPMTCEDYMDLQKRLLNQSDFTFWTEETSGSTGKPKLKIVSQIDEDAEEELCLKYFRKIGIGEGDRVLTIDIDSPEIYQFYSRAFYRAGINTFAFLSFRPGERLPEIVALRPTVILSVPSVIRESMADILKALSIQKLIYFAENMAGSQRKQLEENGVDVYSFYGSTEIGSVAGECYTHKGLHIYNDHAIPTLLNPIELVNRWRGEVVWTTLHFKHQRLTKYRTGDIITIYKNRCSCGSPYPLMSFAVQRTKKTINMYGQKIACEDFEKAVGCDLFIALKGRVLEVCAPPHLDSWKIHEQLINKISSLRYLVQKRFIHLNINCEFRRKSKGIVE